MEREVGRMVVRELVTSNGVKVRIHDDCYAGISAEEAKRRREEIGRVMRDIYIRKVARGETWEEDGAWS